MRQNRKLNSSRGRGGRRSGGRDGGGRQGRDDGGCGGSDCAIRGGGFGGGRHDGTEIFSRSNFAAGTSKLGIGKKKCSS
ncbi:hypothetical protein F3Y22_tig00112225pilonHSYRG00066 [Hibiscus syriacus]|uniref:Uncharacterized protein n=1 Tax=Hibiscus syriacus TaxID=106335 RepID=A0A6A2Y851_HIBSY|nr:hypothetical protein F3Y22_tig00112225pilonHSYRG00066 [Hibiscus syriacus]